MTEASDKKYMQRCIDLAKQAFGNTYPNPMVGCVIVYNDTIIGEGYHKKAGEPHAEVNAIESVVKKELLSKSTMYVNLEPCSHYGKTPPCTLAILQYKIPRVVIGCIDTFSEVSGKGIEMLKREGVSVTVGVLENESRQLNARFFTFHEKKRPYIILKWAQTKDGFIDIAPELKSHSKGIWITDDICKKLVHQWRTEEQSILIGTNTAEIDNPQLTARLVHGNNPVRIVIDLQNRLPQNLYIKDGSVSTIIFTRKKQLSQHNIEYVTIEGKDSLWEEIFSELYKRQIQSIIIEGGAAVLQDCISKKIWDEMRVFIGPSNFIKGIAAPQVLENPTEEFTIGNSNLLFYRKI